MRLPWALALSGAVAFTGLTSAASATTIQVGYVTGVGGGALTNVQTVGNNVQYSQSATGWTNFNTTPNFSLGNETSVTIDTSTDSATNKTPLYLAVNFSGITAPLSSALAFLSTLQVNQALGAQTVEESTYINTGAFSLSGVGVTTSTLGTLLDGVSYGGTGSSALTSSPQNASSTYSIVLLYEIDPGATCGSGCVVHTTASISVDALTTPLPAALPLMAGGLGVIGLFARRKKRSTVAA